MTQGWITPACVFDGQAVLKQVSVRVEDGIIAEISTDARDAPRLPGCLTPGFLDLQVNGGGGVLLNTDPTSAAMVTMAEAHRNFGTVGIMPTVITDAPDVLQAAADAALAAKGQLGILGLHIEGPHIALARRGTHSAAFVRPFEPETLQIVTTLRRAGVPVMITLAPEAVGPDQIAALAATGAVVSIGHTDASADQIEATIAAGATCATHLFNAMSPMTSRAPGAVGGILNAEIAFGMICDGHHVDDRMVRLALRAAGPGDRAFLVSDAMATVGGPDQFQLYGQTVRLKDGRLINSEGSLAGAHIVQAQGVKRLVKNIGLSLNAALRMAITTPATVLNRPDLARLQGRALTDLVLLSDDLDLAATRLDQSPIFRQLDPAK